MGKDDGVLIRLDKAKQYLTEAKTLQDVKRVIAMADAARVFARRIKASVEAENSAVEFGLWAERKLGEILVANPTNKGGEPTKLRDSTGSKKVPVEIPTLADSGIDKKTSARSKDLFSVPVAEFVKSLVCEGRLNRNKVVKSIVDKKQKEARDAKRKAAMSEAEPKSLANVHVGDFRKHADKVVNGSVSLVFTDPPYDRKSIELFDGLGKFSAEKLCDGGSLICYLGHVQLHDAMIALGKHLRFWWPICCLHAGQNALMKEYGIRVGWKPVLWYVKGTRDDKSNIVQDVMSGGKEKSHHDWQQSQPEAEYWIENLCPADGIVCDPFLGGGTTAAAAIKLKRKWIGFEIDSDQAKLAMSRLA